MSTCGTNVVSLVPRTPEQINLIKRRMAEVSQDPQALIKLSLQLRIIRQDLVAEASIFDASSDMLAERNLTLRANTFIEQVEALEASMNKLVGAMTVHQTR